MTIPVSFELAKLLKEKGFNEYCKLCVEEDDERPLPFNAGSTLHKNSLHPYYSAPTLVEVVMWLYENHGIWIYPLPIDDDMKLWQARIIKGEPFNKLNNTLKIISHGEISYRGIYSPTEAYEAAIEYCLRNII